MLVRRPTVLCIEDRMHELDEVTTSLADAGHDVVRTSSKSEALRFMRRQHVDGVLIDAAIRGRDARQLRAELQRECGELPVMLYHGSGVVLQAQLRVLDAWIQHIRK